MGRSSIEKIADRAWAAFSGPTGLSRLGAGPTVGAGDASVSGPEAARDARAALARRIVVLRRTAGLTQRELGVLAGYSRSAVARAEASGACSRPFCVRAGRALGVGGELAAAHDRAAAGPVLEFSTPEWREFVARLMAGEPGHPAAWTD